MEINQMFLDFYTMYFGSEEQAHKYITKCYSFSSHYSIDTAENLVELAPRRVVNNLARLMHYSDILFSSTSHSVNVFFWITIIESICFIPNETYEPEKEKRIRRFFREYVSKTDKSFLIDNIRPIEGRDSFSIEKIGSIFFTLRNSFTHEGDIYFHFPNEKSDSFSVQQISDKRSILLRATYDEVRSIFIRSYLIYIDDLIKSAEGHGSKQ